MARMNNKTNNKFSKGSNKNAKGSNKKGRSNVNFQKNNGSVSFEDNNSKFSGAHPEGCDAKKGMNDPSWYAANPQLLKDSASFSYNASLGSPFRLDTMIGNANSEMVLEPEFSTIPGLMAFQTFLTPGISTDTQSPVNLAAQNVYSFVRYKNSGAANYDSPDLMLYLLAMDSLYSAWNWAKRLYGITATYSQYNTYMPKALIEANNVDFQDIIDNLSNFRAGLNRAATAISSFCVPATFPYFVRHAWMFSNVYLDSNTPKSQMYEFVPAGFYKYDETTSPNGGVLSLIGVTYPSTMPKLKYKDILHILNTMVEALGYSEDIGIMSGDILKAYGESGLYTLTPIGEDYTVVPVYNEEILTQIHNLKNQVVEDNVNFNITQDPNTNCIIFNPAVSTSYGPKTYLEGVSLNMPWKDVEPKDSMVASRLIALLTKDEGGKTAHFNLLPTEFIGKIVVYQYRGVVGKLYSSMTLTAVDFNTSIELRSTATEGQIRNTINSLLFQA